MEYRDVPGLEGYYIVSNTGIVRTVPRKVEVTRNGRTFLQSVTEKELKQHDVGWGYKHVKLFKKNYPVHRLVAIAFIPNPNNLPQVNHIDGDKTNNNVDNLEWCSQKYNKRHSFNRKIELVKDGYTLVADSLAEAGEHLGCKGYSVARVLDGSRNSIYGWTLKGEV